MYTTHGNSVNFRYDNGIWYHFVMTFSVGSGMAVYVNGCPHQIVLAPLPFATHDPSQDVNQRDLVIGYTNMIMLQKNDWPESFENTSFWPHFGPAAQAHIDEFAMVEGVLTPEDIWNIYSRAFV